jgi:phosphate/sulfate permease
MEVAPDMKTALRVWWAITWRCLIAGVGSGMIVGAIVGFIMASAGQEKEMAERVASLVELPIMVFLSTWIVHRLMAQGFGRYRLTLKLRES